MILEVSLWKQRKRNLYHSVKRGGVWEEETGKGMLLEANQPDWGAARHGRGLKGTLGRGWNRSHGVQVRW